MRRFSPILLLALLAGCEPGSYWNGRPTTQLVQAGDRVSEVTLHLGPAAGTLPYPAAATLEAVVARGQAWGTVSLDVLTQQGAAGTAALPVLRAAAALGIPADRIRQGTADLRPATALVRIHAVRLLVPPCAGVPTGSLDDTPSSTFGGQNYVLGCASAVNSAAQIADPRDLTAPAAPVTVDGLRAAQPIDTLNAPPDQSTKSAGNASAGNLTSDLSSALGSGAGGSQ
jgi:pilus biogenesis lipoprotein CpaD